MSGLIEDAVEAPPEEAAVVDEGVQQEAPAVEEAAPVVAERPDYIDEQFWDAEKGVVNSEGLAKSYRELRNAFNKKNNDKIGESAEDYATEEFFAGEGMADLKDDAGLKMAFEAAKEAGMGVKQAHTFINKFMSGMSEFAPQPVDVQGELKKLGKNGPHVVSGIKSWLDGMKNEGQLNDEVHAELVKLGATAAGIKALDVLRQKSGEMNIPTGKALTGSAHMSAADWYAATYETHAEAGESKSAYNVRMQKIGETIFGNGSGTFNGSGLMVNRGRQ